MIVTRLQLASILAAVAVPALVLSQLPSMDSAKAQAGAAQSDAAAKADAASSLDDGDPAEA